MEHKTAHAETLYNIRLLMPVIRYHGEDTTIPLTTDQRIAYRRLMVTLNLWNTHLPEVPPLAEGGLTPDDMQITGGGYGPAGM